MRKFELQRMKEFETVKDYTNKLLGIANKIRLLGGDFADSKIVENFLVTMSERYEAYIVSLENTKDLSKITLAEVVHALQAHEQRRMMREDRVVEGALQAKHHDFGNCRKKIFKKNQLASNENGANNQNKECWLIHSSCTNHMTYDKSTFKDLKPIDVLKIKIGNGDYIQAKGKGTIKFR
ncbi:uncharacterized protein LOC114405621 [Glycine soja]|uniref:uncharacterized protein LOC114405621 n=1 Tax=Glycine soja TaxID=3848 RepID=UPI001038DAD2|nr:uncharacterized protein LOC114405621 [Glycine soja]